MSTYEKFPTVPVPYSMLAGYGAIAAELARALRESSAPCSSWTATRERALTRSSRA